MFWCHEACYPVKIHKLDTLLFKPQGSKHVKKVVAYTLEIIVSAWLKQKQKI